VTGLTRIVTRLGSKAGPFCREQTLDTSIYLDSLIPSEKKP